MHVACVLLLAALLPTSHSRNHDPLAWLYRPQGFFQPDTTGGDCPSECDCPPSFPVAMYCDGRGLRAMPSIPSRIKYLYLQNNAIASVPDASLGNATNLVWLMMQHNQLTSGSIGAKAVSVPEALIPDIFTQAFAKMQRLERLHLHHNNLTRIPPALPRSLRQLRLNHNSIALVTSADLEGMDNLTILYLHDNALTDMGASLRGLKSLTLLDASANGLTTVPEALPELLYQLYLESNAIQSLPEGFLNRLPQLQYVRLAHNRLTDKGIPPNTFNVSGLVELDLSFNKLERIPPVSTSLQHLYLQANHIKEFTLGSFCPVVDVTNFSKLKTLRLEGNEITQRDIPSESAHCLRMASTIEL